VKPRVRRSAPDAPRGQARSDDARRLAGDGGHRGGRQGVHHQGRDHGSHKKDVGSRSTRASSPIKARKRRSSKRRKAVLLSGTFLWNLRALLRRAGGGCRRQDEGRAQGRNAVRESAENGKAEGDDPGGEGRGTVQPFPTTASLRSLDDSPGQRRQPVLPGIGWVSLPPGISLSSFFSPLRLAAPYSRQDLFECTGE